MWWILRQGGGREGSCCACTLRQPRVSCLVWDQVPGFTASGRRRKKDAKAKGRSQLVVGGGKRPVHTATNTKYYLSVTGTQSTREGSITADRPQPDQRQAAQRKRTAVSTPAGRPKTEHTHVNLSSTAHRTNAERERERATSPIKPDYLEYNRVAPKRAAESRRLSPVQAPLPASLQRPSRRAPAAGVPRPRVPREVLDEHRGQQGPELLVLCQGKHRLDIPGGKQIGIEQTISGCKRDLCTNNSRATIAPRGCDARTRVAQQPCLLSGGRSIKKRQG